MQNTNTQPRSYLNEYMRAERWRMFAGHVAAIMLGILAALIALLVGPSLQLLVSERSGGIPWSDLVSPRLAWLPRMIAGTPEISGAELFRVLPLLLVSVAFVKALLGGTQWYIWESLGERVSRRIRHDLMAAYVRLSPGARRDAEGMKVDASIATGISNDVRMLREYIVHFHGGLPREGLQVLFLGVTIFALSPKLFIAFIAGLAPAALVIRKFGKRLRGRAAKVLSETAELGEWIQQRLLGFETIKHFGTEERECAKLRALNETLLDRMMRAGRLRARTSPLIEAFGVAAIVAILYVALDDARSGRVSGAVLISFFSSIALFAQSGAKLGKYFNSNKEGMAAVDRLAACAEFMRGNGVENIAVVSNPGLGVAVSCEAIRVRYDGSAAVALDDVSMDFLPGRVYALAGASGAGKTTLFKVILGLVSPDSGNVSVSGKICYMPQHVQLMSASLLENVSYPEPGGDRSRAVAALREVGIPEFADRLDEIPVAVSGGQAQRILLARIVYHDAQVILVDEGTSALDPGLEKMVYRILRQLAARGACVIMIAHRIPALESADEIVLLEKGRVVEKGAGTSVRQTPAFSRLLAHEAP